MIPSIVPLSWAEPQPVFGIWARRCKCFLRINVSISLNHSATLSILGKYAFPRMSTVQIQGLTQSASLQHLPPGSFSIIQVHHPTRSQKARIAACKFTRPCWASKAMSSATISSRVAPPPAWRQYPFSATVGSHRPTAPADYRLRPQTTLV